MENGNLVTLPDASKILGVSYQTVLKKKLEYGALKVDVPGRVEYAIPARFIREFLDEEMSDLKARIRRLEQHDFTSVDRTNGSEGLDDRTSEMLRLRFDELWTLKEIGEKFGVSRERVRQIIGNSGRGFKSERVKNAALEMTDKTHDEVAEELGLSYGYVAQLRAGVRTPPAGNGPAAVGFKWEEWAAEHLEELGYSCELQNNGHSFDMLVNGSCRVDVKYCSEPRTPPSQKHVSPQWCFAVRGARDNCDLYMCITGEDDVFMIPSDKIPETQDQILFCYPTKRPSLGRYQKYHERYDLIDSFAKASVNGQNGHGA